MMGNRESKKSALIEFGNQTVAIGSLNSELGGNALFFAVFILNLVLDFSTNTAWKGD